MKLIIQACAVAVLAACSPLPAEELQLYTDTFSEARVAGDELLDQVAPFLRETGEDDRSCNIDTRTGFRPCFRVAFALGDDGTRPDDPADIAVRRATLGLVFEYNALVSALASGQSTEALTARINGLAALAGAATQLVPSTGATVAALPISSLSALLARVETMRAQNAASTAILDAEPEISALITLLIEDTPTLYEVFIVQFDGDLGQTKIDLRRAEILGNTAEATRLRARVAALQNPQDNANRARTFERALTAYVRLLRQSDQALRALTTAIRAPTADPIASATRFVRQATEVRALAGQLRSDLAILRNAAGGS